MAWVETKVVELLFLFFRHFTFNQSSSLQLACFSLPLMRKRGVLLSNLEVHLPLKHQQHGLICSSSFLLLSLSLSLSLNVVTSFLQAEAAQVQTAPSNSERGSVAASALKGKSQSSLSAKLSKEVNITYLLLYLFCALVPITAWIGISLEVLCSSMFASFLFCGVWYVFCLPIRRNQKGLLMLKGKKEQLQLRED